MIIFKGDEWGVQEAYGPGSSTKMISYQRTVVPRFMLDRCLLELNDLIMENCQNHEELT